MQSQNQENLDKNYDPEKEESIFSEMYSLEFFVKKCEQSISRLEYLFSLELPHFNENADLYRAIRGKYLLWREDVKEASDLDIELRKVVSACEELIVFHNLLVDDNLIEVSDLIYKDEIEYNLTGLSKEEKKSRELARKFLRTNKQFGESKINPVYCFLENGNIESSFNDYIGVSLLDGEQENFLSKNRGIYDLSLWEDELKETFPNIKGLDILYRISGFFQYSFGYDYYKPTEKLDDIRNEMQTEWLVVLVNLLLGIGLSSVFYFGVDGSFFLNISIVFWVFTIAALVCALSSSSERSFDRQYTKQKLEESNQSIKKISYDYFRNYPHKSHFNATHLKNASVRFVNFLPVLICRKSEFCSELYKWELSVLDPKEKIIYNRRDSKKDLLSVYEIKNIQPISVLDRKGRSTDELGMAIELRELDIIKN